jgi:hypothetical protein
VVENVLLAEVTVDLVVVPSNWSFVALGQVWFVDFGFEEFGFLLLDLSPGLIYFRITHFLPLFWVLLELSGPVTIFLSCGQRFCHCTGNFRNPWNFKALLHFLLGLVYLSVNNRLSQTLLGLHSILVKSIKTFVSGLQWRRSFLSGRRSFRWAKRLRSYKVLFLKRLLIMN